MRTNEYTTGTSALLKKETRCFLYDRSELKLNWSYSREFGPISNFPASASDYYNALRKAPWLPKHTMLTCIERGYYATAKSYWVITDPDSEHFGKCVVLGYDYEVPEHFGFPNGSVFKGLWARDLVTHSAECDC